MVRAALKASLGTLLQPSAPESLWNVISWLAATDQLAEGAPPLDVLREPLRCYGGLDADGRPMAPGEDIDFACQCRVPYDATLPPGIGRHLLGFDPASEQLLYVRTGAVDAGRELRVIAPPDLTVAPEQPVGLRHDPASLHRFDPGTGRRLA